MNEIQKLEALKKSSFRSHFHLSEKEKQYVKEKGLDVIQSHASEFILKRLAPLNPYHDGKQTPMKGHPVFIAQHATATCCRSCLEKWYHFPKDRSLTKKEQEYIVGIIMMWIQEEMK